MKHIFLSLALLFGLSLNQASLANSQVHAVRGFMPDLKFDLIAAHTDHFTEKEVRGKVVLMFFGYANCPDICPTSMAQLAEVMEKLGEKAEQVRILFVSVDPHRDNAAMLQEYVENFDDRYALGLTGTTEQIAALARRYRVAYQIEKPKGNNPKDYEVSHSRGVYFFDAKGKARYLASDSEAVEVMLEKVQSLL